MTRRNGIVTRVLLLALSVMLAGCAGQETGERSGESLQQTAVENATEQVKGSLGSEVKNSGEGVPEIETGQPEESAEPTPTRSPGGKIENISNNEEGHYEFQPHVFSKLYTQIHGEDVRQSFFHLCDALRNGEDTFECSSEYAYYWCIGGRLINYFFPVASYYVEGWNYKNGVGEIEYLIPKEEFLEKEKAFEEMVTGILNESLSDDYDDFEKALALYEYVTKNTTYDYDMYARYHERDAMKEQSTYRCFMEKKGICGEIAGMYSYLLLQCGVDAEEFGGVLRQGESHAWVYVTIDGESYHVDPTWGLTIDYPDLKYFMMTDEIRDKRDDFPVESFSIAGQGDQSRKVLDFWATDDRYKELWQGRYYGMDRENHLIRWKDGYGRIRKFAYGEKKGGE